LVRVANTAAIVPVVDYTHVYYLNSRSPWTGTSQVSAKVADDGTLSEGSGQVDDETWSTILSTVSSLVGDFTGSASGSPATTDAEAGTSATPSVQEFAARLKTMSPMEITRIPELCPDGGPDWPHPEHYVKYAYKLTTSVFKHDHTMQTFDLSKEKQCEPDPTGVTDGSYTITEVKPNADDGGSKKNNTITVSGAVTLPESKDAKVKHKGDGTK